MNIFNKVKEYFKDKPKAITEPIVEKKATKQTKRQSKMRILRFNKALKNQDKRWATTKSFNGLR